MLLSRTGLDLAGFRRRTMSIVALVAVGLVPLVTGGAMAWSFGRRVDTVTGIPVAVVNLDAGATVTVDGKKQTAPLGRELVGLLTQPTTVTRQTLVWTLTDRATATAGLRDGSYHAVLTIPKGYSKALTSVGTDDPTQAVVELTTDDASSVLVSRVSQQVVANATAAAGRTMTKNYLKNVLIGFNDMADGTQQEADGTQKLATGAQQLATGTKKLATGTTKLADGSRQLATGAKTLATGTAALADGATSLADGAQTLADNGSKLTKGSKALTSGAKQLVTGGKAVRTGITQLSAALKPHDDPTTVAQADMTVGDVAALSSMAATGVSTGLQGLSAGCLSSGASQAYCDQLAQVAAGAESADQAAAGTVTAVAAYRTGIDTFGTEFGKFVTGLKKYAKGSAAFTSGVTKFAAGLDQLATGAGKLAAGAGSLSGGTTQIATAQSQLATGTTKLATGTTKLADGSQSLADGTQKLATGIAKGADAIPTYTKDERDQLVKTVATPVTQKVVHRNAVSNGAAAVTSIVLPLALWAGALAAFFVLPSVPRRLALSSASPWAAAFHGWWPATALGVVQAALLSLSVPLLHLHPDHPWLLGVAVVATAVVFTAVNQALSGALGTLGRLVSLVMLGVQAATVGGVVPLDTAPALVQTIGGITPVSLSASLVQRMMLGSSGTSTVACLVGLAIWGLGATLVTVWAVSHRRRAHARVETYVPAADVPTSLEPVPVG